MMKPLCTYKSNNIMQKRLAIDASRLEFGGNQGRVKIMKAFI